MNIFGYKNISKLIMFTTILIILSNTILISLFYYKAQLIDFEESIKELHQNNIKRNKENLKKDIQNIVKMIEYKYNNNISNIKANKTNIKQWLSTLPFDKTKGKYLFVYELLNKEGGEEFAKMEINPNRPDLVGKYLSTEYKDKNGKKFRKIFLDDINKKGESFVKYAYKKSIDKYENKISYLIYYKPLNWIIAKGIYIDDIQNEVALKKQVLKQKVLKQISFNIFFFVLFSIIAVVITYIIGKKIDNIIKEKDKKVKAKTFALATLNKELDNKVKIEVEKNKEKEHILMQKSKFIALGEMISLIAHQWRQPINEISGIVLNIKLHKKLNKLDNTMLDKKSKDIENILEYMSKTIDDFRTFFKPNKKKTQFNINNSISRVLETTNSMLKQYNITITKSIDETITIINFQNELEQVLLNLITNAKDALCLDKIQNPQINISVEKKDKLYIKVTDNANGIDEKLVNKIFEPYFTTKEEANGTGIGLYMSKMIIEENMGGKLEVQSSKKGSCFSISFEA